MVIDCAKFMKTTKTIPEMVEVMQYAHNGGEVQFLSEMTGKWTDSGEKGVSWNWMQLDYRIKPQPKTVPMSLQTFPKLVPVWVKMKNAKDGESEMVVRVAEEGLSIAVLGFMKWDYLMSEGFEYATHLGDWRKMEVEISE